MTSSGSETVDLVGSMNLTGNVIPHSWYQSIKMENGKVDTIGILLLAEIVYWYRPSYELDEDTGQLLRTRKKFKSDLLQRSYKGFEEKFSFTTKQTKEALVRLEKQGLIKRVFRTIDSKDSGRLGNVMFIQLFANKLAEITSISTFNVPPLVSKTIPPSVPESIPLCTQKDIGVSLKGQTNTKSTTKNTTKKKEYREFVTLTEKQYSTLLEKYGKEKTEAMLDILNNYKGSTGKKYDSDYHTIYRWVEKSYEEQRGRRNGKDAEAEKLAREHNLPF